MRYYVEAYAPDGLQILGNLDGQKSWEGTAYKRTAWYRELKERKLRKYPRVKMWKIVRGDMYSGPILVETIYNLDNPCWYT